MTKEAPPDQDARRRFIQRLIGRLRRAAFLLKMSAIVMLLVTIGIIAGGAWLFIAAGAIAADEANVLTRLVRDSTKQMEGVISSMFEKEQNGAVDRLIEAAGSAPESMRIIEDFRAAVASNQRLAAEMRKAMETNLSKVISEQSAAQTWQATISASVARLTAAGLVLFLVQIFITLYRYNYRLGAYYSARADALEMLQEGSLDDLQRMVAILSPDALDFGELPKPPSNDILRAAADVLSAGKAVGRP